MPLSSKKIMEKRATSLELPRTSRQLFVWVFIPYRMTEQGLISEYYDNPETHQDLANVFAELGIKWKWQPITFENMHGVIDEVVASSSEYTPVVLNHCDGEERPDYPGVAVIKLLEEKGIIFTGAGAAFSHLCSSKLWMKRSFVQADVPTAPYEIISDISDIQGICNRLGAPLIVKPVMSLQSRGITLQSVVHDDEQVMMQVKRLVEGQDGTQFPLNCIFIERFISGPEFTVFIIGSANQSNNLKIYPPIERVFHSRLPETERFLSFERYWGTDEESSVSKPFCRFQLVDPVLQSRLCEISQSAYCAVGGNGYGRVDIRMDKDSQQLFVLEVNANCSISSHPLSEFSNPRATTVGTILQLSNISFAQLMSEIIAEAVARTQETLSSCSQCTN